MLLSIVCGLDCSVVFVKNMCLYVIMYLYVTKNTVTEEIKNASITYFDVSLDQFKAYTKF